MMKTIILSLRLISCISLFVSIAASAQIQHYSLDFKLSKKKFADTIQIKYEREQLLVPVSIGGHRYNFLLDTGASNAVVYDDAMINGCVPIGTIPSYDANNRKDTVQVVRLPPLTIGKLSLYGCRATVQRRKIRDKNIDGILGFDLVNKGLQMKIDSREGVMILTDMKHHFDADRGVELKYKQRFHVPYIEIMPFKDYREWTLFDTGSRRIYSINRTQFMENENRMLNRRQIEGRSLGCVSIGYFGVEAMDEVVFLALDSLRLGAFSLTDVHAITTQGKSHLGAAILKYGIISFNPFKKIVRFQPYDGASSCKVGNRQIEKAIVPDKNGHPMIGLLWEKSELFKAGFRVGDVIEAIDGQPLITIDDYLKFHPVKGYSHNFLLKDKTGQSKEMKAKWLK